MILLKLFWSFFQIGLFGFGGGYATLPLIRNQVTEVHHWLSKTEFLDIITISQMTPGAIAINAATFTGQRIYGLAGAIVATVGCVLPSCLILLLISFCFYKYKNLTAIKGILMGLRPAVVALVASAGIAIILASFFGEQVTTVYQIVFRNTDLFAVALFIITLFILRKWKPNPLLTMFGAGLAGFLFYTFI